MNNCVGFDCNSENAISFDVSVCLYNGDGNRELLYHRPVCVPSPSFKGFYVMNS